MVVVLAFSLVAPVSGVSAESNYSGGDANSDQVYQDAQILQDYLTFHSNGKMTFDAESAEKDGVRAELIKQTERDEQKINSSIEENGAKAGVLASCPGVSKIEWAGGFSGILAMDDCLTDQVAYYLTIGAAAATIVSAISAYIKAAPITLVSQIVGGLMAAGAATLSLHNEGSGVYLYFEANSPQDFDFGSQ
ncbi:hypothetical protein [Virgibacillus salexigens]|uniref:hypothetical protein n=1 Tax=Virgibacillus massiliensis TaxID=1462526 RepID=UPI00136E3258|nr:hypothetical protein [Virgibacillus massiliensis]MYL43926.1 hypothetical protein [Virgibacillus massiliensis]